MSTDLVTELRQMAATGYAGSSIWSESADEIERLRNELAQVRQDAVETVQFWAAYASEYFKQKHDLNRDVERLRGASARG